MRASAALSMLAGVFAGVVTAACGADDEVEVTSPCVAFAKAAALALKTEPALTPGRAVPFVRVASGAGRTYALDRAGNLGRIEDGAAGAIAVAGVDFAVDKSASGVVRAFVARWTMQTGATTSFQLVRFASRDGGLTFDRASEKVVLTVPGGRAPGGEATSLAFGPDGLLYVALGDAEPPPGAPPTLLGKLLRLDVSGDAYVAPPDNPFASGGGAPEVWAYPLHQPNGLDVDAETGDVWLTDYSTRDDATLLHRLTRGKTDPLRPMLSIAGADKRAAFAGGHVVRGKRAPGMIGRYVYLASNGSVIAVDRFGPSGTAQTTKLALGAEGPFARGGDGEWLVAPAGSVLGVVAGDPPGPAPASLLATRCFDPAAPSGAVVGAIAYDVSSPLWSDGATKERFVVVPKGAKVTARPDGDLVFPVGTIAVKSFSVDGKRVETRLLVQHDVEDWVGYSYAWNAAGTDADLVAGNRVAPLAGGKSWYFPSSTDCSACHTPAAGYTLGLEAAQLAGHGDGLERLEGKLAAPIDRASLATLVAVDAPPPATAEARARSYLHSNCSSCHREGSATGIAVDLDLRVQIPLAKTGLCREPQADTFGISNARIVAPKDPARSVLVARMRALDERRMPRLASRVVDEAGVAAVLAWISDLAACP